MVKVATSNITDEEEEKVWLQSVVKAFKEIAGDDDLISFEEFKKAINTKESYFAEKYFNFFDKDGNGEVEINEFISSLKTLLEQTELEKLQFLFNIFDTDGNGTVSKHELRIVLGACVSESQMSVTAEQLELLVDALMKAADRDGDGDISFEELSKQFLKYPSLVSGLAISPANWMKTSKSSSKPKVSPVALWLRSHLSMTYLYNNLSRMVFMFFLGLFTLGFFILGCVRYRDKNGFVIVARGCGATLNFLSAIVVIFMLRKSLTWLRNTNLGHYLPIDHSISFHKAIGYAIFFFSFVHTVMHLINIGLYVSPANPTSNYTGLAYWEVLLTTKAHMGGHLDLAPVTGVVLCAVLVTIVLCSLPVIRGSGKFKVFYWSHFLYLAFWTLCLFHGPVFWWYFCVPGSVFVIEKVFNIIMWSNQQRTSEFVIEEVHLLPSKVTHLVISRPAGFNFTAGDYLFIKIPSIAFAEWHPFTISSAPENKHTLWLHIRSLGNWTNKLHDFYASGKYMDDVHAALEEDSMASAVAMQYHSHIPKDELLSVSDQEFKQAKITKKKESPKSRRLDKTLHDRRRVFIDGPFGTPAHGLTRTDHAILVAAGIGVTPFASILQSLLSRHRKANSMDKMLENDHDFKLKKVDFIWVNRDVRDFEWFITLLTQLELAEARENAFDRFLNIHLFLTSAKTKTDLKGVGLQMALELLYQEEQRDLLTGLKTRMQPGRPNWDKLFQSMKDENRGEVHVYFCGSGGLAKVVKEHSLNKGFLFSHSF